MILRKICWIAILQKKSAIGAAVQFYTCKQRQGEFLASQCDFDRTLIALDRILRDLLVAGLSSSPVLSAVMLSNDTNALSSNEAVEKANIVHQIRQDTASLQCSAKINATTLHSEKDSTVINKVSIKKVPNNYVCKRCGTKAYLILLYC